MASVPVMIDATQDSVASVSEILAVVEDTDISVSIKAIPTDKYTPDDSDSWSENNSK